MMDRHTLTLRKTERAAVKFLQVDARVRYWEDAYVDGTTDEYGSLIPFRTGDAWRPLIDLEAGTVVDWPAGTAADVHYKVCDQGRYLLLDADRQEVSRLNGYVPSILSPGGRGWGDYIIMKIDGAGAWDTNPWIVALTFTVERRNIHAVTRAAA